jgi:hypothetical protein
MTLFLMLTPRQRQIALLRARLDHLALLLGATGSAALSLALVGWFLPVGAAAFFALSAVDLAVALTVARRIIHLRHRLAELTFFAP